MTRTRSRTFAVIEVMVAFALVHTGFRAIQKLTSLGRAELAAGLNFTPGVVMTVAALALIAVGRLGLMQSRLNAAFGRPWTILAGRRSVPDS